MAKNNNYTVKPFPKSREIIVDALGQAKRHNHIYGIFEVDVTKAIKIINAHKEKTGERLSFTSWVMRCVANAVDEYPVIHTLRKGSKKLVTFDDVDIKCMIEKETKEGDKIPIQYIIRKANKKSFQDIHNEVRRAQLYNEDAADEDRKAKRTQKLLMFFPKFIRTIIWTLVMRNPHSVRKNIGTIGVTAMGMYGKGIVGWAIPKTPHSTTIAVGAIVKKPIVINEEIVIRDILHLTIEFNHDTVDGAPGARFIKHICDIMGSAYELVQFE
ncbi:MAG: 2-oxo acid dehydrogenase subunit E2 [Candidatus Heimdallarchaeota archaeon]